MIADHKDKIDVLANQICEKLKNDCYRLYVSGGIDPDSYSHKEYVLAKILITVAMEQNKNNFAPLHQPYRDEVKNLLNF